MRCATFWPSNKLKVISNKFDLYLKLIGTDIFLESRGAHSAEFGLNLYELLLITYYLLLN